VIPYPISPPWPILRSGPGKKLIKPHPSHRMGKWYTDVRCPASTSRFYTIRECKKCGYEQFIHNAGRFSDKELTRGCIIE